MTTTEIKLLVISLSNAFDHLVVKGDGIEVEFQDGKIQVHSGKIVTTPTANSLGNTAVPAALKIGDVIEDGNNKGWIYCEGAGVDPFLVAPQDSGVKKWREAMEYAAHFNSELPSRRQLNAIYESRYTGALTGTFNLTGYNPAGWYWSATEDHYKSVWCRRFSNGYESDDSKGYESSVRCVRRYSII